MATIDSAPVYLYAGPSPFPPSFEGNPWSYAFGLFGDVVAASLALAVLLSYLLEKRRFADVNRKLDNQARISMFDPWTPLWLYRTGQMCFLTFVVMRTLPDALWMLAWGEVTQPTIEALLTLDLLFDGLALVPMLAAVMAWAWGRQVIPHKLMEGFVGVVGGRPPWDVVVKNGRIVIVVMVIAVLVTIGKASA